MRFRRILFLALLATIAVAAPASANYRVAVSEQNAAMFDQPAWQSLELERAEAQLHGQEVLVTFTAHRGCWDGRRYSRSKACKAPSQRGYASAIKRFQTTYGIELFTPWNEVNHPSQPTSTSPKLAAQYYATAKRSWSTSPIQNVGSEIPASDAADSTRSAHPRRRTAPSTPNGTAAAAAITTEVTISSAVAGTRSAMRVSTGRPSA